jgi:uncharacterized SAM-binding protein YcdF (DUF218 family)
MLSAGLISLFSCITPRKGPAKAYKNAAALAPFDALIVPGIPYNGRNWDSIMKGRVLWSWILYKNGYVKNVIYSGGAVYTPYQEAVVMGLYARELGIPEANIFYDTLARHSVENVFYSYLLAQRQGFKSIALGTDPFQSVSLRSFTRKRFETPIYHLPFITDSLEVYNNLHPRIDATPAKITTAWSSIKDQESFFKRLGGTLGRKIDWSPYPKRVVGSL